MFNKYSFYHYSHSPSLVLLSGQGDRLLMLLVLLSRFSRVRLCDPMDCSPQAPLSMEFSRQEYWNGLPWPPPGDLPNPGIKPRSPALQVDSLLSEPPGKPKNTVVGNLSFLQGIFPTQELNQGLLHCRRILYQQEMDYS